MSKKEHIELFFFISAFYRVIPTLCIERFQYNRKNCAYYMAVTGWVKWRNLIEANPYDGAK